MRATNVIPLLGEMGVAQKGCRRAKVAPTILIKRLQSEILTYSIYFLSNSIVKNTKSLYNIYECKKFNFYKRKDVFIMQLNKVSVDDINVKGKKVLVRVDFNVPLKDGVITNDNRIQAALPTIKKLIADGGKVILCSHLGKPKNGPEEKFSLAPVAVRLSELLGQDVVFANDDEVVGENAKKAVAEMNDGDVVLLQNTRFRKEETKNLEPFSTELASLAEVFVMDAFGSAHRAHCSTAGVTDHIKDTAVGYLMQKEINYLGNAVETPVRPFVAILGGAKVADKLNVISNLLEKCDTLIIGGGMAQAQRYLQPPREVRHTYHRRRYGLHLPQGSGQRGW